jgi:hypothetical protein
MPGVASVIEDSVKALIVQMQLTFPDDPLAEHA